ELALTAHNEDDPARPRVEHRVLGHRHALAERRLYGDVDEALGPEVGRGRRDQGPHARRARGGVEDGVDGGDARGEAPPGQGWRRDRERLPGTDQTELVLVDLGVDPDALPGQQEIGGIASTARDLTELGLGDALLAELHRRRAYETVRACQRLGKRALRELRPRAHRLAVLDDRLVEPGIVRHRADGADRDGERTAL